MSAGNSDLTARSLRKTARRRFALAEVVAGAGIDLLAGPTPLARRVGVFGAARRAGLRPDRVGAPLVVASRRSGRTAGCCPRRGQPRRNHRDADWHASDAAFQSQHRRRRPGPCGAAHGGVATLRQARRVPERGERDRSEVTAVSTPRLRPSGAVLDALCLGTWAVRDAARHAEAEGAPWSRSCPSRAPRPMAPG
ncbi:hypothetical protein HBB16_02010 [Pseudonocardia sp. MCCB 268]|nr:hypothetical protein [Pseudonocardia cytotoxica]